MGHFTRHLHFGGSKVTGALEDALSYIHPELEVRNRDPKDMVAPTRARNPYILLGLQGIRQRLGCWYVKAVQAGLRLKKQAITKSCNRLSVDRIGSQPTVVRRTTDAGFVISRGGVPIGEYRGQDGFLLESEAIEVAFEDQALEEALGSRRYEGPA